MPQNGPTRLSQIWSPTGGIASSPDSSIHSLLERAGFLRQSHAGLYHLLPLGLRVQSKISHLLETHMHTLSASRVSLSTLSSPTLWHQSGRFPSVRSELFQLTDRKGTPYLLSPTHEEEITSLVAQTIHSPRSLPLRLYQITRKYRDEKRPRGGLLRAREFLMKDLYTFDASRAEALRTYEAVRGAYGAFFRGLGLPVLVARAESGSIGGELSHEFLLTSELGEDTVLECGGGKEGGGCGWVGNEEVLTAGSESEAEADSAPGKLESESGREKRACPECGGPLGSRRAIELGHTFHLGTKYSAPLGASVGGTPLQMGCHGIGISRLLAASAAHCSTSVGLGWPRAIAPFEAVVIPGRNEDVEAAEGVADRLRAGVGEKGSLMDVVVDDRADKELGWKMKDADLVGYPVMLVLGRKWRSEGKVEVQCRRKGVKEDVAAEGVGPAITELLKDL
ncbi:MAG: hypothetical protein MMC23_005185 [Stictis urceolatum]|nr:hypothetical protein [Stictis urceolata]